MDDAAASMKRDGTQRAEAQIQALATEISRKVSWIPEAAILDQVRRLEAQHRSLTTHEARIGRPTDLRKRLERISVAAQDLFGELNALNPEAHAVLQSPIETLNLRWTAGVYELTPQTEEAGSLVWEPDQGALHPPLLSRLQALAKVSHTAAVWVRENCKDGGYRKHLPTTPHQSQQVLFRHCAEMLGRWLAAPSASPPGGALLFDMELFDQLLLFIGQRVHEIATDAQLSVTPRLKPAVKPQGSQWGRAAARKAKIWLFGTPLEKRNLQNKPTA